MSVLNYLSRVGLCGGWNRYGPHQLMCLNAWPSVERGTIRSCGLFWSKRGVAGDVGGREGKDVDFWRSLDSY